MSEHKSAVTKAKDYMSTTHWIVLSVVLIAALFGVIAASNKVSAEDLPAVTTEQPAVVEEEGEGKSWLADKYKEVKDYLSKKYPPAMTEEDGVYVGEEEVPTPTDPISEEKKEVAPVEKKSEGAGSVSVPTPADDGVSVATPPAVNTSEPTDLEKQILSLMEQKEALAKK